MEGNERRLAPSTPDPGEAAGESAESAEHDHIDNDSDHGTGPTGAPPPGEDGREESAAAAEDPVTPITTPADTDEIDETTPSVASPTETPEAAQSTDTSPDEASDATAADTPAPGVAPNGDDAAATRVAAGKPSEPREPPDSDAPAPAPSSARPRQTFEVRTPPPAGAAAVPASTTPTPAGPPAPTDRTAPVDRTPDDGKRSPADEVTQPLPVVPAAATATATVPPPAAPDRAPETARPRHMRPSDRSAKAAEDAEQEKAETDRRRRLYLALALSPLVLVALLIVGWAIDTTVLSGQVLRNVEIAGQPIGGRGEDTLPEVMASLSAELGARPVSIEAVENAPSNLTRSSSTGSVPAEDRAYLSTAAALGLTLDETATTEAALDVGRDGAFFLRPLQWLGSFFSAREVTLQYTVSELQTTATLQEIQGADAAQPIDPMVQLTDTGFVIVPGQMGDGIEVSDVVAALPDAARAAEDSDEPIAITVRQTDVHPRFSNEEAQAVADRANTMTAQGLAVTAGTVSSTIPAEQLRAWISSIVNEAGELDLAFDTAGATAALPTLLGAVGAEPVNATVTLQGGTPVVIPGENGVLCCGEDAGTRVWDALTTGQTTVELEATVSEPEFTTEEVQGWGITQPVGGSRGWQGGAPNGGTGPGFTTYHACCEARVTNIHRIADLVRGAVIPPGGSFSVNDHVGRRTIENGFVEAGAIRDGIHVPEVGGGVSQFATTLFNAAYFAGLDITTYQAHTESFSRYPVGREATMGYPAPDLVIENNSPYGVLIWPTYTDSSLTVTMYSTPYATAEQTGISESMSGNCRVVVTTRTRTYPDGRTENDTFRATYRPGEGQFC